MARLERLNVCRRLAESHIFRQPVVGREPSCLAGPWRRLLGHNSRVMRPVFKEFNQRRKIIELNNKLKEVNPIDRRSNYLEWNLQSELFAFAARLGENIDQQLLLEAFTTTGYVEAELKKQDDLGIQQVKLHQRSNDVLAEAGGCVLEDVLQNALRTVLPALPEEGIQAVKEYLSSEDVLAHISFHIGTKDLILSLEYPPYKSEFAHAVKALIGAIHRGSEERAVKFIQEIVITQLVGKDICEIWDVRNPMGVLATILGNMDMAEPESRLLWQSGPSTLLASFTVGIYSNQQLMGSFAGESVEIAEEMAARDALRRLFRLSDSAAPLPVSPPITNTKPNQSLQDWKDQSPPNLVTS